MSSLHRVVGIFAQRRQALLDRAAAGDADAAYTLRLSDTQRERRWRRRRAAAQGDAQAKAILAREAAAAKGHKVAKAKRVVREEETLASLEKRKSGVELMKKEEEAQEAEVAMERHELKAPKTETDEPGRKVVDEEARRSIVNEAVTKSAEDGSRLATEPVSPAHARKGGENKMSIAFITSAEDKDTASGPTALKREGFFDAAGMQTQEAAQLRNKKWRLEAAKMRFEKRLRQVEVELGETELELALLRRTGEGTGRS